VVARLVEQDGALGVVQRAGEPQPVALAGREVAQRGRLREGGVEQVEPVEQPPARVPRLQLLGRGERGGVALAGVGQLLRERVGGALQLVEGGARAAQRVVDQRRDGRLRRRGQLLLDQRAAGRAGDGAGVGRQRAGEQPQQRALAGAVVADDREPLAGADGERDAVDDAALAEALLQLARDEVGRAALVAVEDAACGAGAHRVPSSVRIARLARAAAPGSSSWIAWLAAEASA
jgi:hypothetical protein